MLIPPITIPDLPDYSNTSAQVQYASVSASGGSSASSYTTTVINSNDNGGHTSVRIETEVDGKKEVKDVEKNIGVDGEDGISIGVATSSADGKSSVSSEVHISTNHSEVKTGTTSGNIVQRIFNKIKATTSVSAGATTSVSQFTAFNTDDSSLKFRTFFSKIFSFFGWNW